MAGCEDLVRLRQFDPRLWIELRYATPRNFTGRILYRSNEAWLRRVTATRLGRAQDRLGERGLGLKVWDAYRPPSAQQALWEACPDERYVAPPARGSRHTRGVAVDVTLVDARGQELAMPSDFDAFGERAWRGWQGAPVEAARHRDWLTEAMAGSGFRPIQTEWWHFDDEAWEGYPLLTYEFADLEKACRSPGRDCAGFGEGGTVVA